PPIIIREFCPAAQSGRGKFTTVMVAMPRTGSRFQYSVALGNNHPGCLYAASTVVVGKVEKTALTSLTSVARCISLD
ncbi:MAG: hypothetical protein P8X86_03475, partial [Desulfofustis sp.]